MAAIGLSWALGGLAALLLATVQGERLRWGAAGLTLAALGAASLRTGAGSEVPSELARLVATGATDQFFLAVGTGLVLLGVIIVAAGARALLPAIGSLLVLLLLLPLFQATGPLRPVGHAGVAAGILALAWGGVGVMAPGRLFRSLDRALLDPAPGAGDASRQQRLPWRAWLPAGIALAACVAPNGVVTLLLAILSMGVAAFLPVRGRGWLRLALPAAIFLTGLSLALAITIIGPLPSSYQALREGPFSDAASVMLVLLLGTAAWIASATWPWHAAVPVPVLLPVAWALLGRFGTGAVPFGLGYWQPVALPIALLGVGHGLTTGRPGRVCAAVGMAGLWTGSVDGSALLLVSALVLDGAAGWAPTQAVPEPLRRLAWLVPGVGAALVLRDLLESQVTWAVLLAGVLILGLMPGPHRGARGVASPPR